MTAIACPSCNAENELGRKFCGECGSALARACPACGAANSPAVKFCGECGTALAAQSRVDSTPGVTSAPVAERRLVSVLFADLVGFTTVSEGRDAEDIRELLSRYFDTSRTIIERYGGTVEKFIGDAVMAVWGAPIANEDDAERAVRAALELVAAIPPLHPALRARAGVLTGEAAVTVGATNEGIIAGDLVNTASRVQSAAEPGTVLAGESTKRATEAAVAYADAGLHDVKGKAEPLHLWRAVRVVAARKGEGRSVALEAPFVGRDRELRIVKDIFHACAKDVRASLVTVIGVAGIGKSRLAWEFEKYIDGLASDVWWHRGRCLSYGEGVAYWALAEMVRGRAGISEDEDESEALAKLHESVREHLKDTDERAWVEPRLQQLLGLIERTGSERNDLFSAWRLFFERLSDSGPVVFVFEDLHWADSGLIEFIEHLLEWSRSNPIFVLALSRPELHDRHPGFGSRVRSGTTLALDPLADEAMDALLTGLVPGLPSDVRLAIRGRADGIPLYAVETVRMLLDRGLLAREGDAYVVEGDLEALAVPETLHALIAARLDGLEPAERQLLERAAVLGKTFSARGLSRLSQEPADDVERILTALVRKEVLSLDADPRSPERGQYGFLQALVQRVAYDTLSRHDRRLLHLAAADHLAEDAGIDPDEIAEVIAAHLRDADAADPAATDAAEIRTRARSWLVRAGERAAALAAPTDARRAFDEAVGLADDGGERAALLERAGELAFDSDEMELAVERLWQAVTAFESEARTHDAARVRARISLALWNLGRTDEAAPLVEEAFAVLAKDEPDADVAWVAAEAARIAWFRGDREAALERVDLALDVAEAQGLPRVLAEALNTKAMVMSHHPHEWRALLREALEVALEHGLTNSALRAYNNLTIALSLSGREEEADALTLEAFDLARRRGTVTFTTWFAGARVGVLYHEGAWDEALALADEFIPELPASQGNAALSRCTLAHIALDREEAGAAKEHLALVAPGMSASTDRQQQAILVYRDSLSARADGRQNELADLAERRIKLGLELGYDESAAWALGHTLDHSPATPTTDALLAPLLHEIDTRSTSHRTQTVDGELDRVRGTLASRSGNHDAAIDAFARALGHARSRGRARLLASVLASYAEALVAAERADEAEPLIAEALSLYSTMGATVYIARLKALDPSHALPA
ncbi:ATP-binding protein [Gaiella sp.]|uniref:ATP-binding protein n=1 Tax=Gaiella sp. TaxID=2663207 RepID=UPI003983B3E4